MLFIFRLILIALFTYLFAWFAPWWMVILSAATIAFFLPGNNLNAFLSGFLGTGLIWMAMAWKIDLDADSIMSLKMVELLPVDDVNMLIIVTALIGGCAGALGAFSGNSFRQLFIKKKEQSFYS